MRSERSRNLDLALDALFGPGIDWRLETGVVHVAAIGASPRAALAVGPDSPRSAADRFVLGFARARADVIVTTGAILRAEPELVHRTSEDPSEAAAWAGWRAEVLGRAGAPALLVLSASGAIDPAHPALQAAPRTIVWTTAAGRARLGPLAAGRVEVVVPAAHAEPAAPGPDGDAQAALVAALRWLRGNGRVRAETIVLEAGPRATAGLYASPRAARGVDELLLGIYAGGPFPAVAGPRLPETEWLAACFAAEASGAIADAEGDSNARAAGRAALRSSVWREEPSGRWRFERYRRARVG
ncbi:MAG: hypothetical protein R3F21_18755 [Myxococcota bacterium]